MSNFDIGLALEPAFSFNNEIALSNKLFTYLLSGLAIIASNTRAQTNFIEENSGIGKLYTIGDTDELANIILAFYENKLLLNSYKETAYHLAQTKYNWELEQNKFLSIINDCISNN